MMKLASLPGVLVLSMGVALAFPATAETGREESGDPAAASATAVSATLAGAAPMPAVAGFDLAQGPASEAAPAPAPAPQQGPASPPAFAMAKPVFDDTWALIGLGVGFVPSYSGSDDYQAFPLPLIAGRLGGVGISPNGPGFVLDLFSPKPTFGPRKTAFSAGPALRVRADRVQQIGDDVVDDLPDLNLAVEVGGNVGVSFPGVFNPRDTLTLGTQVRWDVADAHDGMVIEPQIGYRRNFGSGILFQIQAGAQIVDDSFADYYFTVTPAQSAASGLPVFTAQGGLTSVGGLSIVNFDLDGNVINGGLSLYTVLGYSRLLNDARETPFTDLRGNPNQFLGGVGVGYTF